MQTADTCKLENNKLENNTLNSVLDCDSNKTIRKRYVKADFQSSHEAPRSSLRVMHEHFHPITMLNSSF
jgi:hypothetical protein